MRREDDEIVAVMPTSASDRAHELLADQAARFAWLAEHLPRLPGSGIVYCLTTADCDRVAAWLRHKGIDAVAYHAQMNEEDETRGALEQRLLKNEMKALVASVALGMGFDKPDLGFVVHYQRPGSLIAYYQQIGRAGRSVPEAFAILLNGREDDEIQDYFGRFENAMRRHSRTSSPI